MLVPYRQNRFLSPTLKMEPCIIALLLVAKFSIGLAVVTTLNAINAK